MKLRLDEKVEKDWEEEEEDEDEDSLFDIVRCVKTLILIAFRSDI